MTADDLMPPYADDERYGRRLPILAEAQNWRCCYCGQRCVGVGSAYNAPSTEHVTPLVRGGLRTWKNEVMACSLCNRSRGSLNAMGFYRKVQKNGRRRACNWAKRRRETKRLAYASAAEPTTVGIE